MSFLGVNTVYNHADLRLLDKEALEAICEYQEQALFIRGLVTKLGYKTDTVLHERKSRIAGDSKYNAKKMLSFAWDGITSFTTKPISLIMTLGFLITVLSFVSLICCAVASALGNTVLEWIWVLVCLWIIAGIQLSATGLIGQYIGKIYSETKKRPRYHIKEVVSTDDSKGAM